MALSTRVIDKAAARPGACEAGLTGLLTPEELQAAFVRFEEASHHLSGFYQDLEQRVADLGQALEQSRSEQQAQLGETRRLAERLRNLLQVLPGGVVVLDGNGCVRECNPAAEALLGPVIPGRLWREIVAEVFAPRWDDGHDLTLRDGRRVNLSTQALGNEPGQILLIKDVTETRVLQDQLNRHRRLAAMGEMAAALAHQVRTPLASALLHVSNLRRAHIDDALRNRLTGQALERLQHLERLVSDMLLYARCGAFECTPVSLDSVLEALSQEAGQLKISLCAQAGPVMLQGNRDALVSALRNVIDNAALACGEGGHLQIGTAMASSGIVAIRFKDNGPGIPEPVRAAIFEPFFTTRDGGSGLGLAVSQAVIRAHGGEIALEASSAAGTTFVIHLPVAGAVHAASEP